MVYLAYKLVFRRITLLDSWLSRFVVLKTEATDAWKLEVNHNWAFGRKTAWPLPKLLTPV